jgi:hypothetical protein
MKGNLENSPKEESTMPWIYELRPRFPFSTLEGVFAMRTDL